MTVTQITEAAKSRRRIYLDGQFAFLLYKGELRQFQIAKGQEITEETYRRIMEEVLPKRAKMRSMNLLQAKDYTQKQLEDKLRQGEYPQTCIDEAVAYVKSYGYINDGNYARNFIEYHMEDRSRACMEAQLLRRGISKDVIQRVFEELKEAGIKQDEMAMIRSLLDKRKYETKAATAQERQKMYGYLYRKGFSPDVIMRALS